MDPIKVTVVISPGANTRDTLNSLLAQTCREIEILCHPCADLPGMSAMFQCDTSDMYLCVFYETYNDENVLKFFERFVRDMLEKPKVVDHTGAQPTQ